LLLSFEVLDSQESLFVLVLLLVALAALVVLESLGVPVLLLEFPEVHDSLVVPVLLLVALDFPALVVPVLLIVALETLVTL
jgi:hypothetical protein